MQALLQSFVLFVVVETCVMSDNITRINYNFPVKCLFKDNGKLNVFIPKYLTETFTKKDHALITKKFIDSSMLLIYLSQTIYLQINHQMIKAFDNKSTQIVPNNGKRNFDFQLIIICSDLIHTNSAEKLYAIITKNSDSNNNKFKWKMDYLLTKTNIFYYYKINEQDLPLSFRSISLIQSQPSIQSQLINKAITKENIVAIINNIDIKTLNKKSIKICEEMAMDSKSVQQYINISILNEQFIPILIQKNKKCWIEWVIICDKMGNNFAISFKNYQNKIEVTNIYRSKKDIEIKNNLTGDELQYESLVNFVCNK